MKQMQLRPKPWTHHHAHRLYHLTMGMCFGFAALVMIAGMSAFWMQADAADQGDVLITANVAGVSPGPVDNGSSGSYRPPVNTANPTLTITAEPQGQISRVVIGNGNNQVAAYAFPSAKPAFSGTTSVSNGIVFIYIEGPKSLNSTARATANGRWYWESPDSFPAGTYYIVATVYDSYDLTKSASVREYFTVNVPLTPEEPGAPVSPGTPGTPGGPSTGGPSTGGPDTGQPPVIPPVVASGKLFGLFFEILDQYKTVEAGYKTVGWVSLVSNLDKPISDQEIKYSVTSPQGKVILESIDVVSFSKLSQFLKEFTTAPLTTPGEYTVRISSVYNGIESVSSDKFFVTAAPVAASVEPQGMAVIWSLLILLLILFLILMVIAYRWVRHHTRQIIDAESGSAPI